MAVGRVLDDSKRFLFFIRIAAQPLGLGALVRVGFPGPITQTSTASPSETAKQ
jgi:hypothetical protein